MSLQMAKSKWVLRTLYVVFITVVLISCGVPSTETTGNTPLTISLTDVHSTAQSAAVTLFAQTMTAIPASTAISTETPLASTPTPLPFKAVDGLRVAYTIGGYLYVQDSGKEEIQLTNSGQDLAPVFSDDGQKIVFFRVQLPRKTEVYVINADGTGEKALVTSQLLATLGLGYDEFTQVRYLAFAPGSHRLLFNTHYFSPNNPNAWPVPNHDLLIADADTSEIRQLAAPQQMDNSLFLTGQEGKFLVSPDGNLVAIQGPDHIEVINLNGQAVQPNLVTYLADEAHSYIPMYWTRDSRELIILPSEIPLLAGGVPIVRAVWRYSVDDGRGTEIPLIPPPLYDEYAISPDGNWIVYSYNPRSMASDLVAPVGVYLGNLHDGTSQLVDIIKLQIVMSSAFNWNPNSSHFIFSDNVNSYLGDILGQVTTVGRGTLPIWIDDNHFLYGDSILAELGKEDRVKVIDLPSGLQIDDFESPAIVFLGH